MLGNEEVRDRVESLEIWDKVDSDHQPVVVTIEGEKGRGVRGGGEDVKRVAEEKRGVWDEREKEILRGGVRGFALGEGGIEEQ